MKYTLLGMLMLAALPAVSFADRGDDHRDYDHRSDHRDFDRGDHHDYYRHDGDRDRNFFNFSLGFGSSDTYTSFGFRNYNERPYYPPAVVYPAPVYVTPPPTVYYPAPSYYVSPPVRYYAPASTYYYYR